MPPAPVNVISRTSGSASSPTIWAISRLRPTQGAVCAGRLCGGACSSRPARRRDRHRGGARLCPGVRVQLAVSDTRHQPLGFRPRRDVQLLGQRPPAEFVLGQRCAALPAARQEPHEIAVRLLAPRLQGQRMAGMGDGVRQVAGLGIAGRQRVQARQHQLAQPRPFGSGPMLEVRRFVHVETRQEVARYRLTASSSCAIAAGEAASAWPPRFGRRIPHDPPRLQGSRRSAMQSRSTARKGPRAWRRSKRFLRRLALAAASGRSPQSKPVRSARGRVPLCAARR